MLKAPCEPSAGDVGEEITLAFKNTSLKYLDFFHGMICCMISWHDGGKIYATILYLFSSPFWYYYALMADFSQN